MTNKLFFSFICCERGFSSNVVFRLKSYRKLQHSAWDVRDVRWQFRRSYKYFLVELYENPSNGYASAAHFCPSYITRVMS